MVGVKLIHIRKGAPERSELAPFHDDVIKCKHFRVTGPLCGEFTIHRWIPPTKASDA